MTSRARRNTGTSFSGWTARLMKAAIHEQVRRTRLASSRSASSTSPSQARTRLSSVSAPLRSTSPTGTRSRAAVDRAWVHRAPQTEGDADRRRLLRGGRGGRKRRDGLPARRRGLRRSYRRLRRIRRREVGPSDREEARERDVRECGRNAVSRATTALQAIRDQGRLEEGQRVLVHGASGGVGTYAVQIAKALGGEVTAVCGPQGVEIARSLGADEVVDYSREDVTRSDRRFDLAIDIAGTRSPSGNCGVCSLRRRRSSSSEGKRANRLLGPLAHVAGCKLGAMRASQRATFFLAKLERRTWRRFASSSKRGS